MRHLKQIVVALICLIATASGCVPPSSIRVEQRVTIEVTDSATGTPAVGVVLYVTREDIDRIDGDIYTTDGNGEIELIERLYDGCTTELEFAAYRNCEELGSEDFVTGMMRTIFVSPESETEIIRMEIGLGNRQESGRFVIEVVDVTMPDFKYTS
ncbi:MAG TPA: hypothetical protein PKN33_05635 [Phycisphaerae bacterium]|nr:hypothetical protein [Phycisphaerae bacterium]